ncbi:MAG: hypothetical protein E5W96_15770 [Mesorhizobium sp.]|nr:MAG: hypothetical protein E5W96_15770 [Mesorhizobium sp.]
MGVGLIGKRHVQHVLSEPEATLSAIADPPPALEQWTRTRISTREGLTSGARSRTLQIQLNLPFAFSGVHRSGRASRCQGRIMLL